MSAQQPSGGRAGNAVSPVNRHIPDLPAELGATQSPADIQRMRLAIAPPAVAAQEDRPIHRGVPASVGARLGAFTIDVVLVAVIAAAVYFFSSSVPLTIVAALEVVVIVCVIEARTGATLGNALLRLRATRADRPFSPGVGREFVRCVVTGLGFLAAVGSWIVVASAAWDRGGQRRTWADRAATTLVVAVPRAGTVDEQQVALPVPPPQIVNTVMRAPERAEDAAAADAAAAAIAGAGFAPAIAESPAGPGANSVGLTGLRDAAVPIDNGTLLLIFDTGQRVPLRVPVAANLGRSPVASENGDELIVVNDPDGSVSKTHLRLEHSRGRTWVTDFGSTNGSDIRSDDGAMRVLTAGERVMLEDADRIRVGNRSFTVSVLLGSAPAAGGQS